MSIGVCRKEMVERPVLLLSVYPIHFLTLLKVGLMERMAPQLSTLVSAPSLGEGGLPCSVLADVNV